jgi:hypothetical protein
MMPSPATRTGSRLELLPAFRAELSKFRTVRGWVVGLVLSGGLLVLFAFLTANGMHTGTCNPAPNGAPVCVAGHPYVPTGPAGEGVADSYFLVSRQLSADATLTARVTGLSGVTSSAPVNAAPSSARTRPGAASWSKAGIIITARPRAGAAYAAVMATPGHGIRFQYDYTHDVAGSDGAVSASSPRWLRLRRHGDMVSGYESRNGRSWQLVGTAELAGLPSSARIGLFVTSPVTFDGLATLATGVFDHVTVVGRSRSGGWRGAATGEGRNDFYSTLGAGSFRRAGSVFTIRGSGDIAPAVTAGADTAANILLQPLVVALLVIIVVATLFSTSEYRRGLVRTTLSAIPSRTTALIAKVLVVGLAAFVTGVAAAAVAIPLGTHLMNVNGNYVLRSGGATELRMILGCGALLAFTSVAVSATGVIVRTTAGTVIAGILMFVLPLIVAVPYFQGSGSAPAWLESLLRISPAAAIAVFGALPRSHVVSYPYTIGHGYFPLSPLAGLAILAAWALGLVLVAGVLLQRRDA